MRTETMVSKKISERVKTTHLQILHKLGQQGLYERAVGAGMLQSSKMPHPEIHMLDVSEAFFSLFRSTGNNEYATISRILRKAAHAVYRQLRKQNKEELPEQHSKRFLTLCS